MKCPSIGYLAPLPLSGRDARPPVLSLFLASALGPLAFASRIAALSPGRPLVALLMKKGRGWGPRRVFEGKYKN